jgi:anti-sigma factor RsiW
MMRCETVRESLSAWIDGELSIDASRAVEEHVGSCRACRAEAGRLEALRAALKPVIGPPPVSENEWNQVALAALSRHSERVGWVLLVPGLTAIVVGGLVALLSDPDVPAWLRLSLGGATAGITFLTLSALADRWRARRSERYEGVER